MTKTNQNIESNSVVFAGPFLGEFGWELSHWSPHVRWLRQQYKGRKLIVASYAGRHPLYYGIADEFWNLPDWFVAEKHDCDCFEALCDSTIYAKLFKHFKDRLESNYDFKNVIWTKTPRGFNKTLRENKYVTFDKLKASEGAVKAKDEILKGHGNKPVVILFAREVYRKTFLDVVYNQVRYCEDLRTPLPSNNWPRSNWEDLFDMLYKQFHNQITFVIGGTKGGNCLLNMADKYPDVVDLTDLNITQSLDVTIAMLNSALCSISSQSGPTHLSLQCGCPSFIYGHERQRCTKDDNPLGADVVFMETQLGMYNDSPEVLYEDVAIYIKYLLSEKMGRETFDTGAGSLESLDKLQRFEYDLPFDVSQRHNDKIQSLDKEGIAFDGGGIVSDGNIKILKENETILNQKGIVVECKYRESKAEYNINYYENMLREYSKSAEKISKIRWDFISEINPNKVLDFGSGVGWFRAWRPKDVEVYSYDIGKFAQTGIPTGDFDIICMWDVLEHFENLNEVRYLLDRTKYIALTVPLLPKNQDLKAWKHYKPGEHYHHFSKETLDCFMSGYGFEHIRSGYFECPPRQDILSALYKKTNVTPAVEIDAKIASGVKKIGMIGVFDVDGGTNIPFGKAFANAGYQVDVFNYRTVASQIGWEKTNQEIIKFSEAYDLIIFCKANGITADTIRLCSRNAATCWYMMDSIDHLKASPEYRKMAGAASFSVVTTKAVYDYLANGEVRMPDIHHILQGIDPKEFHPVEADKKYDVVFIGQKSPKRDKYLDAIIAAGFTVKAYGQGYNKPVYGKDFNQACAEGRILLAINNSELTEDSFSDRMLRYMATKGCVLTEYSKGLNNYFHSEIEWFKTERQLIEEIDMLLKNDTLRNSVTENGYKTVLANHTWDKVAEQIIKIATRRES